MSQPAGRPRGVGRRLVLGLVAGAVAATAFGGPLPAALRRALEAPLEDLAPRDGFHFYSVSAGIPAWDPATWSLQVADRRLSLAALRQMPATEVAADFRCVSGWSVAGCRWRGVRLRDLLDLAGAPETARAVRFDSADGAYSDSLPMDVARRADVLLALDLGGRPLTAARGAPVRLVVPGYYGYKGVKWVSRVTAAAALEPGYWELRGYDADARIRD